jgi:hypothetical protein
MAAAGNHGVLRVTGLREVVALVAGFSNGDDQPYLVRPRRSRGNVPGGDERAARSRRLRRRVTKAVSCS